jgi:hypothetical protein
MYAPVALERRAGPPVTIRVPMSRAGAVVLGDAITGRMTALARFCPTLGELSANF